MPQLRRDPGPDSEILDFYARSGEEQRLVENAPGLILDVVGGTGRYAVWLATHGYDTHLVDRSPCTLNRLSADQPPPAVHWQARECAMRGNSLSTMGTRRAYCCWGRCITSRLNARATSQLYGLGNTCSADGMRFCVPVDILAADFSHLLHGRGVTLYAHTAENTMPIQARARPRRAASLSDLQTKPHATLKPICCSAATNLSSISARTGRFRRTSSQRDRRSGGSREHHSQTVPEQTGAAAKPSRT